jgi:hypothetical protein
VVVEDNVNELSLLRVFEIRMLDVGVTVAVVGKEYVFTYSECLSQALVIVHAGRMRPVTFSSVASLSLSLSLSLSPSTMFSHTFSQKVRSKKNTEHKFVFALQFLLGTLLVVRRTG